MSWDPKNPNAWQRQHDAAWTSPRGPERGIVTMTKGWIEYARHHAEEYGSGIGDDGVLGPEWEQIGKALLGMLNGELGRLDGGTLDRLIRQALEEQGFNAD